MNHEELSKHYNFTPEHEGHLKAHTDDSTDVNNYLWDKHEDVPEFGHDPHHEHNIKKMDHALSAYKTPSNLIVYSGIHYDPRGRMNSEKVVHHPAYMSTSLDKDIAKGFASDKPASPRQAKGKHILAIHVPEGHPGAYVGHISHVSSEREFVLPRDTKLKHIKTESEVESSRILRKPYSLHIHHMEVVK